MTGIGHTGLHRDGVPGGTGAIMSRVSLLACRPLGLSGLGLVALLAAAPCAAAADIDYDEAPLARRYDPPPYYRGRVYDEPRAERCRIVHRRSVDGDGREVVRRIRECDEGVVAWRPAPRYREAPPIYEAPRRDYRDYDAPPRPPRGLGPYDDPD
jgi:hypothetical protein